MPTDNLTTIRARDLRGEELRLSVHRRADLICIEFDGHAISLTPVAAVVLVQHLLHAAGAGLVPPTIGGGM